MTDRNAGSVHPHIYISEDGHPAIELQAQFGQLPKLFEIIADSIEHRGRVCFC